MKVIYVESRPVVCKCGHVFCFECGENWHDPVLCRFLKKWIKKCDDDSETSNWIAANTKECPKCNVTIEKDGGCNHMVHNELSNYNADLFIKIFLSFLRSKRFVRIKTASMISAGFA